MFLRLWCGNVGEARPLGINFKTIWPNRFKSVIKSLVKESRTGEKNLKNSLLPRDSFPSAPFCLTTFCLTARLARPCVPGRCHSPNNFPLITHRWWKNLSPPRRFTRCHLQNFSLPKKRSERVFCGGWEHRDAGFNQEFSPFGPQRTDEAAVWRGCQNTDRLFNQQTRLRWMCAHTITGTDCLINSSPVFSDNY